MGTAPEQKDGKRQKWLENYVQATFLYKYFLFYFGKSKSAIRQTLLSLRDISPVRGISLALRYVERNSVFE